jgi:predicted enzyme related to lactoylglutathione lyase
MSVVTTNQPEGTPTWIDLVVPDLERAMAFYGALFGWDYDVGSEDGAVGYTMCLLRGRPVAGLVPSTSPDAPGWTVYLAADDCDATAARVAAAGGAVVMGPSDITDRGRVAIAVDPVGARFGLWQGRAHLGCELVNEPGTLVRNDLATPTPQLARDFYPQAFGFTLDRNDDLPDFDFTFLRRPDGHEVAGIFGAAELASSAWATTFEVADTDAALARATAGGGEAGLPEDFVYGRMATVTDPFGTEISIIARPSDG